MVHHNGPVSDSTRGRFVRDVAVSAKGTAVVRASLDLMHALGAGWWRTLLTLRVPASVPFLLPALRLSHVNAVRSDLQGGRTGSTPSQRRLQAALVAIEPSTGYVRALVGGRNFAESPFNRATDARRQPGSSFKPFLYGAALGSGRFTPISTVNDAPETIRDPYTGKAWRPQNYDRAFDGPMTLRQALTRSKNTVSVRLIEAITPATAIPARRKASTPSCSSARVTEPRRAARTICSSLPARCSRMRRMSTGASGVRK